MTGTIQELMSLYPNLPLILNKIKEDLYNNLPNNNRPTRQQFDESFDKRCGTKTFVEILTKIEDDLRQKTN